MKSVLLISQLLPLRSHNGGSTQIRNLLTALNKRKYLIDFVSFNLPEAEENLIDEVKTFLSHNTRRYFIIPFNKNFSSDIFSCDGILSYYSSKMDGVLNMLSSQGYNAIFAEFTSMGRYLHNFANIPKIINLHELNFLRQFREISQNYKLNDRFYLLYNGLKSIITEIKLLKSADVILSYNQIEVELLKMFINDRDIVYIPLTIEIPEVINKPLKREYDFIFIGNFEHKPNRDSIEFILNNHKAILNGRSLLIGGRNLNLIKYNKKLSEKNINFVNNVDEPYKFFEMGNILLSPVFTGGGARVKIIEAMANGNLIITTEIGAEGLTNEERNGIFIFSKEEFLKGKALEIVNHIEKYEDLILKNRKIVATFHNIDTSLGVRELYLCS